MTEWRAIAGWEGLYEVSDDGRVRSLPKRQVRFNRGVRQVVNWKGRELKPYLKNGYPAVGLKDCRKETIYIHRAVCVAFHGTGPTGWEVAHNDGTRTNNRADNLRWASRAENMQDKALHGVQPMGVDIHNAKLTDELVLMIRQSSVPTCEWARRLGMDASTLSVARNGKTWKHVSGGASSK